MSKITEKKLISRLQELKNIKPTTEWASSLKSQMFDEPAVEIIPQNNPARFAGITGVFSSPVFRAATYSLAAFAFLVVGVFSFAQYDKMPAKTLAVNSQANLSGSSTLDQNIAALNTKINNLATVAKAGNKNTIPAAMTEINSNASALAASLNSNTGVAANPVAIKELASTLKTLSDVPGTNVAADQGVQNLEQTVVSAQIADFQKETLTDNQQAALLAAQNLYAAGNYQDALAQLLPPLWPSN